MSSRAEPKTAPPPAPTWRLDALYRGVSDPSLARDLTLAGSLAQTLRTLAVVGDLPRASAEYVRFLSITDRIAGFSELLEANPEAEPRDRARAAYLRRKLDAMTEVAETVLDAIALAPVDHLTQPGLAARSAWVAAVRGRRPAPKLDDRPAERAERARSLARSFSHRLDAVEVEVAGRAVRVRDAFAGLAGHAPGARRQIAERIDAALARAAPELATFYAERLALEHEEALAVGHVNPFERRAAHDATPVRIAEIAVEAALDVGSSAATWFYTARAERLRLDVFGHWDRRTTPRIEAPPPAPFEQAWAAARNAYAALGRRPLGAIDAARADGRLEIAWPGASYTHPAAGAPYVRAPYRGRFADALDLGHEIGHLVHYVLGLGGDRLTADPGAPLAEGAALFGEGRMFDALRTLLVAEGRDVADWALLERALAGVRLDYLTNSVTRLAAHDRFERRAIILAAREAVSAETLADAWLSVYRRAWGSAVETPDGFGHWWALSGLLFEPLYAYAYVAGEAVAAALDRFGAEKGASALMLAFDDIMSAGGSIDVVRALDRLEVNAADPGAWAALYARRLDRVLDAYDA